jgi:DNA-binding phage protein
VAKSRALGWPLTPNATACAQFWLNAASARLDEASEPMTHDFRASVRVLGYSPSQAAVAAGIALRTAYRILSGEQEPHLSMTLAIARHEHLVRVGCEERVPAPKRGRPKGS